MKIQKSTLFLITNFTIFMKIQQKLSNKINHVDSSCIIKWVMNRKNIIIQMPVGFAPRNVVVSKDWIISVIRLIVKIPNKLGVGWFKMPNLITAKVPRYVGKEYCGGWVMAKSILFMISYQYL